MAREARKKTVGSAMMEIREMYERAAINRTLAGYLRTKYLPRDAASAQQKIACLGSPVGEAMIDEMARELEEGAREIEKSAKAQEGEEIQ